MTDFDLGHIFHGSERIIPQVTPNSTTEVTGVNQIAHDQAHTPPPTMPPEVSLRLSIHCESLEKPTKINALILNVPGNKQYVVTTAGCLSKAEWESVLRVQLQSSSEILLGELTGPPQYLGEHTADHSPNLTLVPEMGQGLAIWQLPMTIKLPGLSLAQDSQKGEDVWLLVHLWNHQPQQHLYHCRIADVARTILHLHQVDRFSFDSFIGSPFVNHKGEVVGLLLGGGDFTLVGVSIPAFRRQLSVWNIFLPSGR